MQNSTKLVFFFGYYGPIGLIIGIIMDKKCKKMIVRLESCKLMAIFDNNVDCTVAKLCHWP